MDVTYQVAWREGDTVFYVDASGYRYIAKKGNLAWRINNPGLVKHHCRYAKKMVRLLGLCRSVEVKREAARELARTTGHESARGEGTPEKKATQRDSKSPRFPSISF